MTDNDIDPEHAELKSSIRQKLARYENPAKGKAALLEGLSAMTWVPKEEVNGHTKFELVPNHRMRVASAEVMLELAQQGEES